jgi:hypothetical protein
VRYIHPLLRSYIHQHLLFNESYLKAIPSREELHRSSWERALELSSDEENKIRGI